MSCPGIVQADSLASARFVSEFAQFFGRASIIPSRAIGLALQCVGLDLGEFEADLGEGVIAEHVFWPHVWVQM